MSRTAASPIHDRRLLELPGGEAVVRGRRAGERLIERLAVHAASAGRSGGGWTGLRRGGAFDGVVPSELHYPELEFLRRHADRELACFEHEVESSPESVRLLWNLDAASLGLPRRFGLGLALALRDRCAAAGRRFVLFAGAAPPLRLASPDEVIRVLQEPLGRVRLGGHGTGEPTADFEIVSRESALPSPAAGGRLRGVFLADRSRVALFRRGRRGWRVEARVVLHSPRRRLRP